MNKNELDLLIPFQTQDQFSALQLQLHSQHIWMILKGKQEELAWLCVAHILMLYISLVSGEEGGGC